MENIQDIVSFHINEAINKTNVDEAVNISKFHLQKYLELIKKDIKAKSYEFEDVSTRGNTMMKVVFNTNLTLLISIDGNYGEIVGYNVDGLDQYNQLPKNINSYKDIKKNIKMLSFFDVKKAKPKEAIIKTDKKVNHVQINMVDEMENYGIKSLTGGLTMDMLKKKFAWILKCKMKDAELSLDHGELLFVYGDISGGVCESLYINDGTATFRTIKNIVLIDGCAATVKCEVFKNGTVISGYLICDTIEDGNIQGGVNTFNIINGGDFRNCIIEVDRFINGGDFNTVNFNGECDISMGEFDDCNIRGAHNIDGGKFVGNHIEVDSISNGLFKQTTIKGAKISFGNFVDCLAMSSVEMNGGIWEKGDFNGSVWGVDAIWKSGVWKSGSGVQKPSELINIENQGAAITKQQVNKNEIDFNKCENATSRQNSNLIKKLLSQMFGGVFSVTNTGHSISISWDDGASTKSVMKITGLLSQGSFDGMTDSYNYSDVNTGLIIDNKIIQGERYVFAKQEIREETLFKLAISLSNHMKFSDFAPFKGTKEDLYSDRPKPYGDAWNWASLVRRKIYDNNNFPIAKVMNNLKPENITWMLETGKSYVILEIGGKKYDSRHPIVSTPKVQFLAYSGAIDTTKNLKF